MSTHTPSTSPMTPSLVEPPSLDDPSFSTSATHISFLAPTVTTTSTPTHPQVFRHNNHIHPTIQLNPQHPMAGMVRWQTIRRDVGIEAHAVTESITRFVTLVITAVLAIAAWIASPLPQALVRRFNSGELEKNEKGVAKAETKLVGKDQDQEGQSETRNKQEKLRCQKTSKTVKEVDEPNIMECKHAQKAPPSVRELLTSSDGYRHSAGLQTDSNETREAGHKSVPTVTEKNARHATGDEDDEGEVEEDHATIRTMIHGVDGDGEMEGAVDGPEKETSGTSLWQRACGVQWSDAVATAIDHGADYSDGPSLRFLMRQISRAARSPRPCVRAHVRSSTGVQESMHSMLETMMAQKVKVVFVAQRGVWGLEAVQKFGDGCGVDLRTTFRRKSGGRGCEVSITARVPPGTSQAMVARAVACVSGLQEAFMRAQAMEL